MVFILAVQDCSSCFLCLPSGRRLRGLCKLPEGRDCTGKSWVLVWWAGPCSGKLKNFTQWNNKTWLFANGQGCTHSLSCWAWGNPALESTGSTVGLMVASTRAHANGHPQDRHCQCCRPCGRPLLAHSSTGGPSTLAGSSAHLLWSHLLFPRIPVHTRFCLCPPRVESVSFSPAIKSLWPSKSDSLGIPNPFAGSLG